MIMELQVNEDLNHTKITVINFLFPFFWNPDKWKKNVSFNQVNFSRLKIFLWFIQNCSIKSEENSKKYKLPKPFETWNLEILRLNLLF